MFLCQAILTVELLDSATGSCSLLLTSIKRMALGAYFNVNIALCGTCLKSVAAVAGNVRNNVLRLDIFLHRKSPFNSRVLRFGSELLINISESIFFHKHYGIISPNVRLCKKKI